jgi:hypothetical protein
MDKNLTPFKEKIIKHAKIEFPTMVTRRKET